MVTIITILLIFMYSIYDELAILNKQSNIHGEKIFTKIHNELSNLRKQSTNHNKLILDKIDYLLSNLDVLEKKPELIYFISDIKNNLNSLNTDLSLEIKSFLKIVKKFLKIKNQFIKFKSANLILTDHINFNNYTNSILKSIIVKNKKLSTKLEEFNITLNTKNSYYNFYLSNLIKLQILHYLDQKIIKIILVEQNLYLKI